MSKLIAPDEVAPGTPGIPRLLTVHAHPDDEASKGAATIRRVVDEGGEAVLVTATGGEQGDILNPALDTPENKAAIAELRRHELARAARIIGFREVVMLGYRDSGMADSEANAHPEAFANADLDEAIGRLVAIIRRLRPHVVITYGDERKWYPHPDHVQVHTISGPAFEAAADPRRYPDAGEPWHVSKLYHSAWSRRRFKAMHEKFLELGLESPFGDEWFERLDGAFDTPDITTSIDVTGLYHVRKAALQAHATQVDPDSPFWFGLPDDVAADLFRHDDFVLAESRVDTTLPESDLFAGVDITR